MVESLPELKDEEEMSGDEHTREKLATEPAVEKPVAKKIAEVETAADDDSADTWQTHGVVHPIIVKPVEHRILHFLREGALATQHVNGCLTLAITLGADHNGFDDNALVDRLQQFGDAVGLPAGEWASSRCRSNEFHSPSWYRSRSASANRSPRAVPATSFNRVVG